MATFFKDLKFFFVLVRSNERHFMVHHPYYLTARASVNILRFKFLRVLATAARWRKGGVCRKQLVFQLEEVC
jgi:hypothetical protein